MAAKVERIQNVLTEFFDAVFDCHHNVLQLLRKRYILTKKFKTEYLMKKIQCKTLTAANGGPMLHIPLLYFFEPIITAFTIGKM